MTKSLRLPRSSSCATCYGTPDRFPGGLAARMANAGLMFLAPWPLRCGPVKDLIHFEVSGRILPFSFDPRRCALPVKRVLASSHITDVLRRVWADILGASAGTHSAQRYCCSFGPTGASKHSSRSPVCDELQNRKPMQKRRLAAPNS